LPIKKLCGLLVTPLAECAAPDDASDEFDIEYRREVFRWASDQVRDTVTERTWQAFWQTTVEDSAIAEVAEKLDMRVGSVYIARSRIMTRLRELVRQFEEREE